MSHTTIHGFKALVANRVAKDPSNLDLVLKLENNFFDLVKDRHRFTSQLTSLNKGSSSKRYWSDLNNIVDSDRREVLWCEFLRERRNHKRALRSGLNKTNRSISSVVRLYKSLTIETK